MNEKYYINDYDRILIETKEITDFTDHFSPNNWDLKFDNGLIMFLEENKKLYFTNKSKGIIISKASSKQTAYINIDRCGTMEFYLELSIIFNQTSHDSETVFYIKVNDDVKYKIKESKNIKINIDLKENDQLKFVLKQNNDCKTKYNLILYNFSYSYKNKTSKCIDIATLKQLLTPEQPKGFIDNEYNKGECGEQGFQGPQGPQGPQGNMGYSGPQGSIGERGPQGPQGSRGNTGTKGVQGERGSLWTSGEEKPLNNDSDKNGDQYLDTKLGDVYEYNIAGWFKTGNIKGHQGDIGENFRYIKRTIYTSGSGIHKFNPNTRTAYFQIVGGGGAGGGTESLSALIPQPFTNYILYGIGSAGGSGAYGERWLSMNSFPDFTYTIGNGGSGAYLQNQLFAPNGNDSVINNDDIGFKLTGKGGKGGMSIINQIIPDTISISGSPGNAIGGVGGDNTGLNSSDTLNVNGSTGENGTVNVIILSTNFIPNATIPNLVTVALVAGTQSNPSFGQSYNTNTISVLYDIINNLLPATSVSGVNGLVYGGGGSGALIVVPSNKPDPELLIQNGGNGANGFLSIIEYGNI